jgi:hypothetical protein
MDILNQLIQLEAKKDPQKDIETNIEIKNKENIKTEKKAAYNKFIKRLHDFNASQEDYNKLVSSLNQDSWHQIAFKIKI